MKVFVIIPAAGLGTRMAPADTKTQTAKNAKVSKQFTQLGDALSLFIRCANLPPRIR